MIDVTNVAAIDLNLLAALESLLAEASVGRAAARMNRSQPAMSHALKRLRQMRSRHRRHHKVQYLRGRKDPPADPAPGS
jgi:hypothetical protein